MGVASRRSKDPRRAAAPWAVSFRGADGKRKIRYCRTKEDAETLFAQWRTEIRQGRYRNQVERREPGAVLTFRAVRTLGELCDVYAKHRAALVRDGGNPPACLDGRDRVHGDLPAALLCAPEGVRNHAGGHRGFPRTACN